MRSDGATRRIVIVDLGAAQDVKIVGAATAMPVAAKKRRRFIPELREESVIEVLMTPDLNGRCEKKMAPACGARRNSKFSKHLRAPHNASSDAASDRVKVWGGSALLLKGSHL